MSSLLTNTASMAALQTLRSINDQMSVTQNRISSGLRVDTASDNAAYWSIATTMRSDNAAMSTVSDALGLGAAQVDVAYTAMDSVKDTLDSIKQKLTAASQPGIDKSKIQSEIKQLQNDLKTYAGSASFSGSNWLSVDKTASEKIVASFTRDADGGISLGTIDVDTSKTALFNADSTTGAEKGLLEKGSALDEVAGLADDAKVAGGASGTAATITAFDFTTGTTITLDDNDVLKFDLVFNGEAKTITIDKATVDTALSATDGTIGDAADMVTVLSAAIGNAGLVDGSGGDVTVAAGTGTTVTITHNTADADSTLEIKNADSSNNGNFLDATTFDITNATADDLNTYLQGIDAMFSKVTSAASDLGAIKTRISNQGDFVGKLMDAVDRGVGQLVDADMNAESTRLKALQTQQQLGIQALSIANSSSQNILSLFR